MFIPGHWSGRYGLKKTQGGLSLALAIAAQGVFYVVHEVWMRNNPYGALSGPPGSAGSWLPVDLFLVLLLAPVPWSLLFVFGRPAAFAYMTAIGVLLAVVMDYGLFVVPAIYGVPVFLFSIYLKKVK